MKCRPVTCWLRWDKKKKQWAHNHLEFGFASGDQPEPESDQQKQVWPNRYWKRKHRFLSEENKVYQATAK